MKKAIIAYDLAECERSCIATRNAVTAQPCPHHYTWQCPWAKERFVFLTTSPAHAELLGEAVPDP